MTAKWKWTKLVGRAFYFKRELLEMKSTWQGLVSDGLLQGSDSKMGERGEEFSWCQISRLPLILGEVFSARIIKQM